MRRFVKCGPPYLAGTWLIASIPEPEVCYALCMITNVFRFAAWGMLLSAPLTAAPAPTPEQILADASRYTVKVQVLNEIALNQDDGGAAMGTGFAVGPNSTKSRITSFCIHS